MHYQIFLPNLSGADPEHLVRVGLETLTVRAQFLDVEAGPENQRGLLVGWIGGRTRQVGYFPDKQTWRPAIAAEGLEAGRYWVGFQNGSPPTPEDLQRDYPHHGAAVTLGDGNRWLVPKAHELPADMIRADDGSWKFEVQRRFHAFWIESLEWHSRLMDLGPGASIELGPVAEFVERALQINYRLTPEVINELRLFTSGEGGTVMLTLAALMEIVRLESPEGEGASR